MPDFMKKYAAGIDIGGTNLRCGAVGADGTVKNSLKVSLKEFSGNPKKQAGFIILSIKNFLKANKSLNIKVLGIGIAGQIDAGTGDVLFSPNLGWRDVPLKKMLEKETGLNAHIVNDLTAITYGEWKLGAGRGENNIICIFVGTGIGSGMVLNGSLYGGCCGAAGEIGHITVVSGGRKCTCGNRGCLEAYAGGWGIAEIAKDRAFSDKRAFGNIVKKTGGILDISAETVAGAYYEGDEDAAALIEETGKYLSDGVISAVNFLNPCAVILGGGVIEGIPDLLETISDEVHKRALKAASQNIKISKSALGKNAGIIGAAGLAMRGMREE